MQVDLSDVDSSRLASLRECSGLTPEGFCRWLAARNSGIVLLSGDWLFKQVPEQQQPLYFMALAEQGYLQAAEAEDYLLLITPHGLQQLQQQLQEAELKVFQGISSDDGSISRSQDAVEAAAAALNQSRLSGLFGMLSGVIGSNLSSTTAGQQGQGQTAGSSASGQGPANLTLWQQLVSTARKLAARPLPVDSCIKLALPSSVWWNRGFDDSRISNAISESINDKTQLTIAFKREVSGEPCTLEVKVQMEACMKQEVRCQAMGPSAGVYNRVQQ
jgi:hypothetical protein